MRKSIKEKRAEVKTYLGAHPKTRVFLEYSSSIIICLCAAVLFALAYKIFQSPDVPHILPIISGGTAGLARTVALVFEMTLGITDTTLVYSISYAILNIPIIYLAFRHIGTRFAIFTTINVIATSLITNFINFPFLTEMATHIACVVPTDNGLYLQAGMLARVFFAGVLNGVGSSISFACGGSAGGVDTVSYFFSLRKSRNIGHFVLTINSFVFLLFASLSAVNSIVINKEVVSSAIADASLILLFALVYSFVIAVVIDFITTTNKKEQIQIITKEESLAKLLLANVPHGVTIVRSKGAFTGEDRIIIYAVVSNFETKGVVDLVKEADPHSFITTTSIKLAYGRFRKPKIK